MKNVLRAAAVLLMLAVGLGLSPTAVDGAPSRGKSASSITLVVLADATSTDGAGDVVASVVSPGPTYGSAVTFDVSTTRTDEPWVRLRCYDASSGELIASGWHGFFPDYTFGQDFELASAVWTGQAANCVAELTSSTSGGKWRTLASTEFDVPAA